MIESFDTKLLSSFCLWLDYTILQKGRAFKTISSQFYRTEENRFPLYSYSSPFKSFVWDSSVTGAIIPSGISGSAGFITKGTNSLKFDYPNGRILTSGIDNYSGTYSVKDFNIYLSNNEEADIIFNSRYNWNPRYGTYYSGCSPTDYYAPAIFVNIEKGQNDPFALGGEDVSKMSLRCSVINNDYLSSVDLTSLIKDYTNTCFVLLDSAATPFNIYGDFKNGYYSYEEVRNTAITNNNPLIRIDYVSSSKLNDKTIRSRGEIIDFLFVDLSCLRYPRQYYN
jgi:hypothetical protein